MNHLLKIDTSAQGVSEAFTENSTNHCDRWLIDWLIDWLIVPVFPAPSAVNMKHGSQESWNTWLFLYWKQSRVPRLRHLAVGLLSIWANASKLVSYAWLAADRTSGCPLWLATQPCLLPTASSCDKRPQVYRPLSQWLMSVRRFV